MTEPMLTVHWEHPVAFRWTGPNVSPLPDTVAYMPASPPTRSSQEILAVDPGQTCGWALLSDWEPRLVIGECPFEQLCPQQHEQPLHHPEVLVAELPPRGTVRAYDHEVFMAAGVIRWLRPDVIWQRPPDMVPAKTWHKLGRIKGGGSISQHARDALAHLVFHLITERRKRESTA